MVFMRVIIGSFVGLVLGFLTFFFMFNSSDDRKTELVSVKNLPASGTADIGGGFDLIDQNGEKVSDKDFAGKFTLVYFGYSYCPDVCPTGLDNISAALKLLGPDEDKIQPLFITVDPQRDDVTTLKSFARNFHNNFRFLTGDQAVINDVMKKYRVYAQKFVPESSAPLINSAVVASSADPSANAATDTSTTATTTSLATPLATSLATTLATSTTPETSGADDNYLIDHSSFIYIMDPKGQLLMTYTHQTSPQDLASGIKSAMKNYSLG